MGAELQLSGSAWLVSEHFTSLLRTRAVSSAQVNLAHDSPDTRMGLCLQNMVGGRNRAVLRSGCSAVGLSNINLP